MDFKTFMKTVGKVGGALIEGVNEGIKKVIEIRESTADYGTIELNEDELLQLRWMDCKTIDAYLGNRKVRIAKDAGAMRQLRWMDDDQVDVLRNHM